MQIKDLLHDSKVITTRHHNQVPTITPILRLNRLRRPTLNQAEAAPIYSLRTVLNTPLALIPNTPLTHRLSYQGKAHAFNRNRAPTSSRNLHLTILPSPHIT